MQDHYWLVPGASSRDKAELLTAMMKALAGNAYISFEGDLSHCRFPADLTCSAEETAILRRNTIHPRQDFVIISLETATIDQILDTVLPEDKFVKEVTHIQIERDGTLQFGAYDNFHPECVMSIGVPHLRLDQLRSSGALRSYQLAPD
jgi:hypothetical protein